jgi:hypothetical protein
MKIKIVFLIFAFALGFLPFSNAEIKNSILVKVGNEIITSLDLRNEILTNLIVNKIDVNQENIDASKNLAIKNLINKKIKRIEITKYQITDYNKNDLQKYLTNISNLFETNSSGLKKLFETNNIDYDTFVYNYETELLWNTLIFRIYSNQTNINIIEVENELEKIKNDKADLDPEEIKKQIINTKKQEKLNLFSRSHFSNLENSTNIEFK